MQIFILSICLNYYLWFTKNKVKRFIVILFSIFYLIPAIGVSINLHRCGKKITIIELNSSHKRQCPCGKKMPSNCCKDVRLSFKIADDQKCSNNFITPQTVNFNHLYTLPSVSLCNECFSQKAIFDFSCYHAPPNKNKQPVYLINSIFRI